ncbi:MAG: hypothetical protein AAGA02_14580, partial [Bacteroidota bacterium]
MFLNRDQRILITNILAFVMVCPEPSAGSFPMGVFVEMKRFAKMADGPSVKPIWRIYQIISCSQS